MDVADQLIRIFCDIWHTRHRSMINAMTHLISALAAYAIEPLKLSAIKLLSADARGSGLRRETPSSGYN